MTLKSQTVWDMTVLSLSFHSPGSPGALSSHMTLERPVSQHSDAVTFGKWVGRRGRLIPLWSQDSLEACCVWSLSGHFNICPRPWICPHVAPAITGESPRSLFLPSLCRCPAYCCCCLPQCCVFYTLTSQVLLLFFCFSFTFYSNIKHNWC